MLELAPGDASFASRVAEFYRRRGYEVRENAKVRGSSQRVYPLRLVASGPLGALAVSFGDAGGVDELEASRIRSLAKDIGATPVLATPHPTLQLRGAAARLAVVLLDEEALEEQAPPTPVQEIRKDLATHPWPASGRSASDPWPSGTSRAVEVDDLLAELARPKPALPPRPSTPGAPPAPLVDVGLAVPAGKSALPASLPQPFGWLDGLGGPAEGEATVPAPAAAQPPVPAAELASEVLAPVPLPHVPAIEVELPAPALRAADRAFLRLRWAKRLAWAGLGLAGLWLLGRWLGA